VAEPKIPEWPEWNTVEKLKKEFEVIGIYLSGHPLDDYKLEAGAFKTANIADLDKFTDKGEVVIVGYVSSTDTKISKAGDKYCIFHFEDFTGSIELGLYKNNYLKFRNYVEEPGYVLYIKGNYQTDRNDPERRRFWVSEVELLSEMRTKRAMKVTMQVRLSGVNQEFLHQLNEVLKANPGKDQLQLKVYEEEEHYDICFRSMNGCIRIDNGLLNKLGELGEVNLMVNQ
jgi:DNA polymerase-3 subunit alpha